MTIVEVITSLWEELISGDPSAKFTKYRIIYLADETARGKAARNRIDGAYSYHHAFEELIYRSYRSPFS